MAKSVQDFDANMVSRDPDGKTVWHDARGLTLEGKAFADSDGPYCRMPARAKGKVTEAVWHLGHHSAGMSVRFETDATTISAKWKLADEGTVGAEQLWMNHMAAAGVSGLDLYVWDGPRGWRWVGVGRPTTRTNRGELVQGLRPGMKSFRLYLPLYNALDSLQVGVPEGATLRATVVPQPTRIVYYGTSITHGGCASRAGMAYSSIVQRWLEKETPRRAIETINLGFSGSGKAEIEMADLLGEIDASVYVIDCLANCVGSDEVLRIEEFVRRVRQLRPGRAIVLMEQAFFTHAEFVDQVYRDITNRNVFLRGLRDRLLAEGWQDLHYIDGADLLGDDGEATVDGAHPTDLGFVRMAEVVKPVIVKALETK